MHALCIYSTLKILILLLSRYVLDSNKSLPFFCLIVLENSTKHSKNQNVLPVPNQANYIHNTRNNTARENLEKDKQIKRKPKSAMVSPQGKFV